MSIKKVFIFGLSLLFVSNNAFAGLISIPVVSTDETFTISNWNNSMSIIKNEMNGSLNYLNIANDGLTEANMADEINPRIRTDEIVGDFTYSGMLPATDDLDLTSDISAGVSYIDGYRIATSATSHTYTASKDTWVYIDINGAFQYEEVANGASQPTTPANSLLLAKVVTDSDNITSVTDSRTTAPPAIRTYQKYRQGLKVKRSSASALTVGVGEIDLGTAGKLRYNSSASTVDWDDIDTGTEATDTMYYVWAYPTATDQTTASFKISTSSTDATGVTNERLVGWFWNDNAGNINEYGVSNYIGDGSGVGNVICSTSTSPVAMAANTLTTINTLTFDTSGSKVLFHWGINVDMDAGAEAIFNGCLSVDGADLTASRQGQYINDTREWGVAGSYGINTLGAGVHTVQLKSFLETNAGDCIGNYLIVEEI